MAVLTLSGSSRHVANPLPATSNSSSWHMDGVTAVTAASSSSHVASMPAVTPSSGNWPCAGRCTRSHKVAPTWAVAAACNGAMGSQPLVAPPSCRRVVSASLAPASCTSTSTDFQCSSREIGGWKLPGSFGALGSRKLPNWLRNHTVLISPLTRCRGDSRALVESCEKEHPNSVVNPTVVASSSLSSCIGDSRGPGFPLTLPSGPGNVFETSQKQSLPLTLPSAPGRSPCPARHGQLQLPVSIRRSRGHRAAFPASVVAFVSPPAGGSHSCRNFRAEASLSSAGNSPYRATRTADEVLDSRLGEIDLGEEEFPSRPEPATPVVEVVEQVEVQAEGPFRVIDLDSKETTVDYLGESTKGDMKLKPSSGGGTVGGSSGGSWSSLKFPRDFLAETKRKGETGAQALEHAMWGTDGAQSAARPKSLVDSSESAALLQHLGIPAMFPHGLPSRGIFCSRTLNLRSITTIGYDMDYTLIHYNVNAWEGRAYEYAKENLRSRGYPVDGLTFDPDLVIRGLVIDKRNGNIVKADRFGLVKRAMHGTSMLSQGSISELYGRELVDLRDESRWEFLNTLFSVSEAVIYLQMVDRLDAGLLPLEIARSDYAALYQVVSRALFRAHVEGQLKAEIIDEPERFVELDAELPLALLDQKEAGKRLLLITNSDYPYTNRMMTHSFDRFLPGNMTWRNLFDMVIVSARKPEFFSQAHPLYEIVTPDGLMRPCFKASPGGLYCGGSAQMVEKALGFSGDETLYVGDHIYTDVSQSKLHLRWRTCLVCREFEREVEALVAGQEERQRVIVLMDEKDRVGECFNQLRLAFQRRAADRTPQLSLKMGTTIVFGSRTASNSTPPTWGPQTPEVAEMEEAELLGAMKKLLRTMEELDQEIAPLLDQDGALFNKRWGYLCRAGLWDKSHLTRQIEKYADIYTSRVSNFLWYTPFMYFRSQRQLIAHDAHATWPMSNFFRSFTE